MTDPIDAERIVLGAAMVSDGVTVGVTVLEPHEFSRPPHRDLWALMRRMAGDGLPVSPVSVADALADSPVKGIDGPYLHTLFESVPVTQNVGFYAGIVREHAELRAIHAAGQRMVQAASHDDAEIAKANARQTLDALDRRDSAGSTVRIGEHVTATLQAIEAGQDPAVSTPWPDLDAVVKLRPGTVTVIAARPGLGKSILALQLAAHAARQGTVLLHSLEMPLEELMRRLLSATSGVSFSSLNGQPNDLEWARLAKHLDGLSELGLHVDDRATITVGEITANARRLARTGLRLLVVDYLQLITSADPRLPRQEQVAECARALKLLAKDLSVPVVVLAQLNRESEKRADRRPVLADLRESGAIEAHADAVCLLYRELDRKDAPLEVGIGKNRGGPCRRVDLAWDAEHMRVSSLARWAS